MEAIQVIPDRSKTFYKFEDFGLLERVIEAYITLGEIPEALKLIERVHQLSESIDDPNRIGAPDLSKIADLYIKVGEQQKATPILEQAFEQIKNSPDARASIYQLSRIAPLYAALGQHHKVAESLQLLQQAHQTLTDVQKFIAQQYAATGQDARAIQMVQSIRDIPERTGIQTEMAQQYIGAEKYTQARQITEAIANPEMRAYTLSQLAAQASRLGKGEVAAQLLTLAMQISQVQNNPYLRAELWVNVAAGLIAGQQTEKGLAMLAEALQTVEKAGSQQAAAPKVLLAIADQYAAAGQPERAQPLLDQVLRFVQTSKVPALSNSIFTCDPASSANYDFKTIETGDLAMHYAITGNFPQALTLVQGIDPKYCYFIADQFRQLLDQAIQANQPDWALKILPLALQTEPKESSVEKTTRHVSKLIAIAQSYRKVGKLDAALRLLAQAQEIAQR